jgi:glycosyltransferase involved in cell wall biosynthesis
MLEAMAMRKPVVMSQSGCLHINPETDGFGLQIKPSHIRGWVDAINHLHKDNKEALAMGYRGREIVERDFTIERFNQDILLFIETILNKS